MTRWFEDIAIDEAFPLGSHTFTEAEIIRFGQLYDPQYFHVDPEAAKHSHFGGLVASGWHTVTVGHRQMVDALFAEEDRLRGLGQEPGVSGPSPGVNTMEFKAPVRPGDTVTYTLVVTGKRAVQLDPRLGPAVQHHRGRQPARRTGLSRRTGRLFQAARLQNATKAASADGVDPTPRFGESARPAPDDPMRRLALALASLTLACRAAPRRRRRSPSARPKAIGAASRSSTTPRPAC